MIYREVNTNNQAPFFQIKPVLLLIQINYKIHLLDNLPAPFFTGLLVKKIICLLLFVLLILCDYFDNSLIQELRSLFAQNI